MHACEFEAVGTSDVVPFPPVRRVLKLCHEVRLNPCEGVVRRAEVGEIALARVLVAALGAGLLGVADPRLPR
eukprot:4029946-Lingulodinium_polyedra.AAC.1